MKKRVMILFGGNSSEYEVSCLSAAGVAKNINVEKYDVIMVGITKAGDWMLTNAGIEEIANGKWVNNNENVEAFLSQGNNKAGLLVYNNDKFNLIKIDCIFPILHGKYGEDGSLQGLMQLSGIPYVGCGVQASVVGFDKALTKEVVKSIGVKQARSIVVYKDDMKYEETLDEIVDLFENKYPLFVKPAREGSSVGVSKVVKFEELEEALNLGFKYDKKLLIEEYINGREIEIAILGTEEIEASPVGEVIANDNFYSYEAKYKSSSSETRVLVDLDKDIYENIKRSAIMIYKQLECKDLARVDFFLKKNGEIIFNEINTMPGFTPISMYPKLWQNKGVSYSELISKLIDSAICE